MILKSSPLSSTSSRRHPLISLTPLIDVVFILLVFFMLASSFTNWRSIDLGDSGSSAGVSAGRAPVLIEVLESGLRYAGQAISVDGLVIKINSLLIDDPEQRVLVRPGQNVAIQQVVELLDVLAINGTHSLVLVGDK
ncbi:MAG: biopolymer transport protein ExbD [Parasphingorhabdus sp.]|jgi:biopolymer transport protein ExbD